MFDSDGLDSVNVRIPDELLRIIDSIVKKGIFSSRAEAIREFLREYTLDSRTESKNSISKPSISKMNGSKKNGGHNE